MRQRFYLLLSISLLLCTSCMTQPVSDGPEERDIPQKSDCSSFAIGCYDELAHQPANISCFRPMSRWSQATLTWRLTQPLPETVGMSVSQQNEAIESALAHWAAASSLSFERVEDGSADIEISFTGGSHGDPFAFDGAGGTLGHAFFPSTPLAGQVHLCQAEAWSTTPSEDQFDLFTVVLHELGHTLGLEHSLDPDAVMAPGYQKLTSLTDKDVTAIQGLYGNADGSIAPLPIGSPELLASVCNANDLRALNDPDTDGDGIPDTIEVFILGTDPFKKNTDDDGEDDFAEVFLRGTSPLLFDPRDDEDGDGLSAAQEAQAGTDPTKADTDGDGLADGPELRFFGTDPNNPDTDGDGFNDKLDPAPNNSRFPRDCNQNLIPDMLEIMNGSVADCQPNGIPDDCELAGNDLNANDVPDDCEPGRVLDCDSNGSVDEIEIASDSSLDCNGNQLLDICESQQDCDNNGVLDLCDLAVGGALDCNANGAPDKCDLVNGVSNDCNNTNIPDECELAGNDNNGNDIPDECETSPPSPPTPPAITDCNNNGVDDAIDIAVQGADCDSNNMLDVCELAAGAADCNTNSMLDACEILAGTADDANGNGVLDECETIFVNPNASGTGDGSSWTDAFASLQDALAEAKVRGVAVVWVAANTYTPDVGKFQTLNVQTATFPLQAGLSSPFGVSIYGGFKGDETRFSQRDFRNNVTILSGDLKGDDGANGFLDNSYHVVTANAAGVGAVLDGFMITGGNASIIGTDDLGGGLVVTGSARPIIQNCLFENNFSFTKGGAVHIASTGGVNISDCVFRANDALNGGAIFLAAGSNVHFTRCTFENHNTADGSGGAIYGESAFAVIESCVFRNNIAAVNGGAYYSDGQGSHQFVSCIFRDNSSFSAGGAIHVATGSASIVNTVFINNISSVDGGAVRAANCDLTVINSTFAANQSLDGSGGGIFSAGVGTAIVANSIFWGNTSSNSIGELIQIDSDPGVTNTVEFCLIEGLDGSTFSGLGNIGLDPFFVLDPSVNLASADVRLQINSPCLDVGDNSLLPVDMFDLDMDGDVTESLPLDLDNLSRTFDNFGLGAGPIVDMGAYELNALR